MSGHSRWSQIKRQKEVADQKKGQLFSKLSKVISIAARRGADPEMNMELKNAIEKAREANMPKENIERAIKRGTGELAGEHIDDLFKVDHHAGDLFHDVPHVGSPVYPVVVIVVKKRSAVVVHKYPHRLSKG